MGDEQCPIRVQQAIGGRQRQRTQINIYSENFMITLTSHRSLELSYSQYTSVEIICVICAAHVNKTTVGGKKNAPVPKRQRYFICYF